MEFLGFEPLKDGRHRLNHGAIASAQNNKML